MPEREDAVDADAVEQVPHHRVGRRRVPRRRRAEHAAAAAARQLEAQRDARRRRHQARQRAQHAQQRHLGAGRGGGVAVGGWRSRAQQVDEHVAERRRVAPRARDDAERRHLARRAPEDDGVHEELAAVAVGEHKEDEARRRRRQLPLLIAGRLRQEERQLRLELRAG